MCLNCRTTFLGMSTVAAISVTITVLDFLIIDIAMTFLWTR